MGNCDDQLVLKPHGTSHMTWEATDDRSKKTLENYEDSIDGGHNRKGPPKKNKICKGQSSHASNAFLKDFSGESECFDQANEISDTIFQFQTSLTRAVHISNITKTFLTGESMLDYKLVGGARMPMDGLIYDDKTASEMSSSCHFPLINSQAIETNGLFEGEHVVGREYDFLEHPWDNINHLSNLEDVDSIFQDQLFPSTTADVDMASPIRTSFVGMQCKSTPITLKSDVSLKNVSPSQHHGAGETYTTVGDDLVDEGTIEPMVLNQLKAVIMQLSLRTRIYIRDALYRLARNAKQRHAVTEGGSTLGVCGDSLNSRIQLNQELLSFSRYNEIDLVETETNPIDRCIAELLFSTQSSHSSINGTDKHLLSSSFDVETKTTSSLGTSGLTQERDGQGATVASPYFALTTALDSVDPFQRSKLINVEMLTGDARTNPTNCEDENELKAGLHTLATRTSGKGLQCSDIYQTSGSNLSYPRESNCFNACLGLPYFGLRQETPHLFRLPVDLDHNFKGDKAQDFYAMKGNSRGETTAQNNNFF
ncbi:uncharacterized protein LOC131031105 [Cryptomeria japonica]|uniref:uncharacterized protein LOC131031105 n=1 Tax=Cryptomeria japonica TaxID=3369 RepID=UPI0027DA4B9D|nr:uncharacterized protein LOC131031105 [Cryptomeria japonica]XP_057818122.2 uncharacterized protein LOC131031105 [Cryptomeria japonica]XP_057818123.2 uncharacterized protein LOC131031105 [Cryptomeria japonica]